MLRDPYWRTFALVIGPVHHEGCENVAISEPPGAETARRYVSAVHDAVRARRIAPELVREVEDIGEEVRDVDERLPLTQHCAGRVPPLLDGVIPMLRATLLREDHVSVVRDVSRGVNVGASRLEELVHDDAVVDSETARRQSVERRHRADPDDDEIRGQAAAARRHDLRHVSGTLEGCGGLACKQRHTVLFVVLREEH